MDFILARGNTMSLVSHDVEHQVHDHLRILETPKQTLNIPKSVEVLCDTIEHNFAVTAEALRSRASGLRKAADVLEDRARQLNSAAPKIGDTVTKWIDYENESMSMAEALSFVERSVE
jgi:hypothetical protein